MSRARTATRWRLRWTFGLWCAALAAGGAAAAGCDDSNLGGGLDGGDTTLPADTDVVDHSYPIDPGSTFHYSFARTYVVDISNLSDCAGVGGLEEADKISATGDVCARIDAVDDGWPDNTPTTLAATVQVSGGTQGTDVFVSRLDLDGCVVPVTAGEADAATAPLWLAHMPTALDHGLLEPDDQFVFTTRGGATPPDTLLARLLFFDPREADNRLWRGWVDVAGDVAGAESTVGEVYEYFRTTYGGPFLSDSTRFRYRNTEPTGGCAFNTSSACEAEAGCDWDLGDDRCHSAPVTLELVWRETLAATDPRPPPAGLDGPVIHTLTLTYGWNGALATAIEYVKPDALPPTDALSFTLANCVSGTGGACASALMRVGIEPFATAPCTF